jgi:hypothetical protein
MLKKILKRTGIALLSLILLFALLLLLFHAVENIRGKRVWEQYKRECAAQGEDIEDWQSLIPPPIPDDDNIAMTPIFQDLLAGRKQIRLPPPPRYTNSVPGSAWEIGKHRDLDPWRVTLSNDNVLAALSVYDDDLREVEEALKHPLFRSEEWDTWNLTASPPVNIGVSVNMYRLRSWARLDAGQYNESFEDIKIGIRIANLEQINPTYVAALVRAGMLGIMLSPIWLGISEQVWDKHQLATFQDMLGNINFVEHIALANRFECRWCANMLISTSRKNISTMFNGDPSFTEKVIGYAIPRGWLYQNAVHVVKGIAPLYSAFHADDRRFDVSLLKSIEKETFERPEIDFSTIYSIVSMMCAPLMSSIKRCAQTQATIHQAVLACAIERYRLEHGRIPQRLDELVPAFLDKIPNDPIDGQPMRYKLSDDSGYVLYSIGWNETDDGGELAWTEKRGIKKVDMDQGDWIWRSCPAEEKE